jgi:SNF2 family DNA or RNA helicase
MGAILADEVGLGKTIEAGLIIAQKWAKRKRHILLIVPAFLRKQWERELKDKFFLNSAILDSKTVKFRKETDFINPFNDQNNIIICSYESISLKFLSNNLPMIA